MGSSRWIVPRVLTTLLLFLNCLHLTDSSYSGITKIHGLVFDPSYAKPGERFCMKLNYTIEQGHYLHKLQLEVDAEQVTEVYSFSKEHPSDTGLPYYYDNDWGNRAARARFDLDRTFCFRSIKETDLELTFVWRLYTNSITSHGSKARFHYFFNLPPEHSISKSNGPSLHGKTKINGIIFEPTYAKVGDPLCMSLNYTVEEGHYLHTLQLEVDTKGSEEEGTKVYSFSRQDSYDKGMPEYYDNEWGRKAIKTRYDLDRMFCFQFISDSDLKQTFIWRLFSVNSRHSGVKSRFHYFFNIPESRNMRKTESEGKVATKIYDITFDPLFVQEDQALCMKLNYSIEGGHFLSKLQLEVETEGGVEIYSFTKQTAQDAGTPHYGSNDWGRRIEKRTEDLDKVFCFTFIRNADFRHKFVWRLHSQNIVYDGIKSRFHYFFRIPEHVSTSHAASLEHVSSSHAASLGSSQAVLTKMFGINFSPTYVRFGRPLCMMLNYTVERGHFLSKIELQVSANGGTDVYSFTKQNAEDPGSAHFFHNDWGNRVNQSKADIDKLFCLTYIKRTDMGYSFLWRIHSQSTSYHGDRRIYTYNFRMPDQDSVTKPSINSEVSTTASLTKVHGVTFNPSPAKVGNQFCMTVNYSIQNGHFLKKLNLHVEDEENTEIYSFTKEDASDPGTAEFPKNEWGDRAERAQSGNEKTFCFSSLKRNDLSHTFVWTVQSQNQVYSRITRKYSYVFALPDAHERTTSEGGSGGSITKFYGLTFNPAYIKYNEPLCMNLNYTLQPGHYLKEIRLKVARNHSLIYSFTKDSETDPGTPFYSSNDWGKRVFKSQFDMGNLFCFTNMKRSDMNQAYVWRLISQDLQNPSSQGRWSYLFQLPSSEHDSILTDIGKTEDDDKYIYSSATKIYGIKFEPEQTAVGLPLCMVLNYTIEDGHFLQKLRLAVDGEKEIYSFTRESNQEVGEATYSNDDWSNRADKQVVNKEKEFCFKNIKQSDIDPSYVWTVQSQSNAHSGIRRRFHYIFNIPNIYATHSSKEVLLLSSLTKIYGVQFEPLNAKVGEPLCMVLNYTIQEGHFMQKLQLEVDSDDNPEIYFFVKKSHEDPGIVMYSDNDWGDRAEKTGKNTDKTFCLKRVKASDLKHTYLWILQSQHATYSGIIRRFRYIFTFPESESFVKHNETTVTTSLHSTNFHGLKFEPIAMEIGDPLCMKLNYSIQEGHFLYLMELEVDADDGRRKIFTLTRPRITDPGVAIYQDNDWGVRAERRSHDKDKMFCFKFMKENDIDYDYIWTIHSQGIVRHNDRAKSQHSFNLPEPDYIDKQPIEPIDPFLLPTTRITGVNFDPPYATVGDPFCMIMNYAVQDGHFLQNVLLEVQDEDEIYSLIKQSSNDPGVVIYSDNEWGERAERLNEYKDHAFCFDVIKRSDLGQKFVWSIQSQSVTHPNVKRKFRYVFTIPDYEFYQSSMNLLPVSEHPSETQIKQISFNPQYATPGRPLCLTLNYTLQHGHFLSNMNLEADVGGGSDIYTFSKYQPSATPHVTYHSNVWGARVKKHQEDQDNTICFERIERDDLKHRLIWTIVSQSLISSSVRKKDQRAFSLAESDTTGSPVTDLGVGSHLVFTKIHGVHFDPPSGTDGHPFCLTVDYTLQDANFLKSLTLEVLADEETKVYSYSKSHAHDTGRVVYYNNPWGDRADKSRKDWNQTFCFTEITQKDFEHTFVWRLLSQNMYSKDLQRSSHYSFALPATSSAHGTGGQSIVSYGSDTKLNGVTFNPGHTVFGEHLCMGLNYTLQVGHFLQQAALEVKDDTEVPLYTFSKRKMSDSGQSTYYDNPWSARADKIYHQREPFFCFKNIKGDELAYIFNWKLISQDIFNPGLIKKVYYNFRIPDEEKIGKLDVSPDYAMVGRFDGFHDTTGGDALRIHDVVSNPSLAAPGDNLCFSVNYTIADGYFLRQLLLQTGEEKPDGIYSFTKRHPDDEGVPFYYDNTWGHRGDRLVHDKNTTFCLVGSQSGDFAIPLIWKAYAQNNADPEVTAKDSYIFSVPDATPHDHYGGFDDRYHVTIELIVGLMVAFVVLFAFIGLLVYLFCCNCGLDSNCTCTPENSCGRDTEACLAQQRLLNQ